MQFTTLIFLMMPAIQAFASPATDLYYKITDRSDYCKNKQTELDSVLPKEFDKENDRRFIPSEKVSWAIESLQKISFPSQAEANSLITAAEENAERAFKHSGKIVGNDCVMLRIRMFRALTNTAKSGKSKDVIKIRDTLLNVLKKPKFPTLLNASVELSIIRNGLEGGFWFLLDPTKARLNALESEILTLTKEINPVFDDFNLESKDDWSANPKFIKTVKPALIKEFRESKRFLKEVRMFAEQLK